MEIIANAAPSKSKTRASQQEITIRKFGVQVQTKNARADILLCCSENCNFAGFIGAQAQGEN